MSHYPTLEMASGLRAEFIFDEPGRLDILWSPATPTNLTQAQIDTYRAWRNTCIEQYARESGKRTLVVDL